MPRGKSARNLIALPGPAMALPKLAQLASEALDRALMLVDHLAGEVTRLTRENAELKSQLSQIEDPEVMQRMAEKISLLQERLTGHLDRAV